MHNFLFDVDRTLVDSYKVELETLSEALFIVTGIKYDMNKIRMISTLTTDNFFKEIGFSNNQKMIEIVNKTWGKLLQQKKISLFPGVKEQLELLKFQNCFLGIITSRTMIELEELDELMQLLPIFDFVVTSDMVSHPKPDPESIHFVLEKFNLEVKKTIYIGDSVGDWIAAKQAGINFGYASWENKNQQIHDVIILDNPQQIISLYEK